MILMQKTAGCLFGLGLGMLALSLSMTAWTFMRLAKIDMTLRDRGHRSQDMAVNAVGSLPVVSSVEQQPQSQQPISAVALVPIPNAPQALSLDEATLKCQSLKCSDRNQYSYWVRSGYNINEGPTICFNGQLVVSPNQPDTFSRGVNIVVIHAKLKTLMDYRSFDTYTSPDACLELTQYLSINVPFQSIVLIASFDDMSYCFCDNAKKVLLEFGSKLISDVKFRGNWVFVGQSGLLTGLAIEKLANKDDKEFADRTEIQGCTNVPFATGYVPITVDLGLEHANCGVPNCGFDELALHVFTGQQSANKPKICVAGHHIIWPGVKGGRGFNLVVVDPLSKNVVAVRHFDSYVTDSSNIDLFLESITAGHFLIGVVHDEASNCLHGATPALFGEFGIDLVKQLKMRSVMYFVGRRGLAKSAFQEISHSPAATQWPVPIDKRLCLPSEFNMELKQNVPLNTNRSLFCFSHGGYGNFCYVHHKNEIIVPVPPVANSAFDSIYGVPILVIAGLNHRALMLTLQSLIAVPGLVPSQVMVARLDYFEEFAKLGKLFAFNDLPVTNATNYSTLLGNALEAAWQRNPQAEYIIVIDEEVIVAETFLDYMHKAQLAMKANELIGAASAWNPYGFSNLAIDPTAIYFLDDFVGMAFLLSKKFYTNHMVGQVDSCCAKRSWEGWFSPHSSEQYLFLIPEVSRADYYTSDAYGTRLARDSQNDHRSHALARQFGYANMRALTQPEYEDYLVSSMRNAVNLKELLEDIFWKTPDVSYNVSDQQPGRRDRSPRLIIYNSTISGDYSVLCRLIQHLDLIRGNDCTKPKGLYKGVLRLSLNGKPTFLLGTMSIFFSALQKSRTFERREIVAIADVNW